MSNTKLYRGVSLILLQRGVVLSHDAKAGDQLQAREIRYDPNEQEVTLTLRGVRRRCMKQLSQDTKRRSQTNDILATNYRERMSLRIVQCQ